MAGEWPEVFLSDLTVMPITYGVVQPGQDVRNGLPMLRVNNFKGHSLDLSEVMRISPEIESKYERTRIHYGDILITVVGSIGQVAIVPDNLSGWNIARAIAVIRPKSPEFSRWISLVLRSPQAQYQLGVTANTTVQTTVNLKDLRKLKIPFPDEKTRSAIAHILGTLDDKIELNRKRNETLEAMARALFQDWFVDFGPVHAKMEGQAPYLPSHIWDLFPDRLDDEGKPEGWDKGLISDISIVSSGKRPAERFANPAEVATVPVWGGNGPMAFTSEHLFDEPILLTGRVGTLGSVFRINGLCWPSDNTIVFRTTSAVFFEYLLFQLREVDFLSLNRGSTQPLVTQRDIKNQEIIIPSGDIVREFHRAASDIYRRIDQLDRESKTLTTVRDTLLPKLISGELRIKDADKFLEQAT